MDLSDAAALEAPTRLGLESTRCDLIGGQCEVYTLSEEIQQLRPEGSFVGDGFPEKNKTKKKEKRQVSGAEPAGRPASEESCLDC